MSDPFEVKNRLSEGASSRTPEFDEFPIARTELPEEPPRLIQAPSTTF